MPRLEPSGQVACYILARAALYDWRPATMSIQRGLSVRESHQGLDVRRSQRHLQSIAWTQRDQRLRFHGMPRDHPQAILLRD